MLFHESLKFQRSKTKMTQKTVAESIGISLRGYQQYEQGLFEPNIEKLIKLADTFDISLDTLVGREFPVEIDDG